jgi:predicted small integral membrane protein
MTLLIIIISIYSVICIIEGIIVYKARKRDNYSPGAFEAFLGLAITGLAILIIIGPSCSK